MSKIKFCLITAAVISGVMGAFANKSKALCETQPQYYKQGTTYLPAGDYGIDYVCYSAAGTCTYYQSNPFDPNSFVPCRTGAFTWSFRGK